MSVASIVSAIIVIILSGCVDSSLEKELQAQQKQYCEMVELHKESGGEYGYPDYQRNFEEVCK
tara:strand:- start:66446 stop:66634 length:189 start_codon:yes stop_codon:yes gene_type:complete